MSENIYSLVGGHSNFQYFILFFIFISQFNTSLNILQPIFVNNYQDFFCIVPSNRTVEVFNSHRGQFKNIDNATGFLVIENRFCSKKLLADLCSDIIMKKDPMTSTIRSQFELYCERNWLSSFSVLLFMIGICLGSMFGGIFADRFGRIAGCILSYFMISVFSTISAIVPWFGVYAAARLITGFSVSICFVANSGMTLEVVELKQRTTFGFCWSIGYDTGYVLLVLLAFFVRNHFALQLIISSISYIALIFPFFYKESFRWLLATDKYEKAKIVLLHIARFNKKDVTEYQVDKAIEVFNEEKVKTVVKAVSLKEVLKYKVVLINLICLWFIFFSCSFSYYTFVLGSSKVSEKLFVATIISAIACLLARILYLLLCRRIGRISVLLSLQLGVAILFIASMILKYFMGSKNMITTVLLMIAISLSGTNFGFMWIYGGEAFPTVIRGTSVSIGSACARISGMIASQMGWVFDVAPNALPIFGTVMAIIGSLCTFFILPETFKRPSLDFLPQAEKCFIEWRQPWRKRIKESSEIEIKEEIV